ncbi:penicillin-binding protein activator [Methylomarinum vadi]|uniref:penicillin-binding protein activator n=1 Tax=Methylomarinum vadi TaxID=438855 RepID=UPI001F20AB6A|nr:penicillin-binding protein activator [Methylomarinum vadi]
MMTRHRLTCCFFGLALLSACTPVPTQNQLFLEQAAEADNLMSAGQHKQAARLYQNLAESQPTRQNQFRLLAARALVRSGDHDKAKQYADSIDPAGLSEQQRQQLNLVYAQINLSHGNAEQALHRLQLVRPDLLHSEDRKGFYQSEAFAYSLTGDLLASAKARIQLSELLTAPQEINENNAAILETLSLLPRQALILNQPPAPDILGGWMALANLLQQRPSDNVEFSDELLRWRRNFPTHPANSGFLQAYLQKPHHAFKQPSAIAILLPESGPYAQAGKAIREGFMAAYYQQQNNAPQPTIRFYDSHQGHPITLYDQAVANGAELIIGPLEKDNIAALAAGSELNVPVLALNHVDNLSKSNLFQFGLSPIDEARQLAAKAWQEGHQKILILTPRGEQGERIANYLAEAWLQADGTVLATQSFNANEHDFSYPIQHILNLDESERRYRQLRNLLGRNLKYTPRRRHDVDAIFINAYPVTARSLNPQLRFYHAVDVPVYAMPQLYSGVPNPSQDIDLNNITFCDIPWLFPSAYQGELNQEALRNSWQQFPNVYLRLIALGIDAYNLVSHLDKLDTAKYHGATGDLLLNGENRITRQLICAKFTDGIPVVTGFTDPASEDYQSIATDEPSPSPSDSPASDAR